jgi:hypothetical protein
VSLSGQEEVIYFLSHRNSNQRMILEKDNAAADDDDSGGDGKSVFISDIDFKINENEFRDFIEENCGKINKLVMPVKE